MFFGLGEDHIPAREERVGKEKENLKKLLEAMDMPNAAIEVKKSKRSGSYHQDVRRRPVKVTSNMERIAKRN